MSLETSRQTTSRKMSTTTEKKPEDDKKTHLTHLEEDDEFEDFPAEDWTDAEAGVNLPGGKTALWEDNWDDDDVEDDFSNQLKYVDPRSAECNVQRGPLGSSLRDSRRTCARLYTPSSLSSLLFVNMITTGRSSRTSSSRLVSPSPCNSKITQREGKNRPTEGRMCGARAVRIGGRTETASSNSKRAIIPQGNGNDHRHGITCIRRE
ncbi:hypothetical protein G7K_3541-t1 [Saitoella complicata NRRL Y-17804]|uniref:26S proteasome complex subunit SEM1 n=1 Tax=Saitoella complicata (strain BCRC 22490 / CBS 7301 / JCM 7358 / NBRC 10748 / NRRL Y-17804) TaxID=698492 RepID=A0A0E9NI94_SAICN|nr:hypothetical protein G7K_3541-t1 [Saitoella complicata NRRL Y-17804]